MLSRETTNTSAQKTSPGQAALKADTNCDREMAMQVSMAAMAMGRMTSSSAI
jgi:hypothetical protein